MTDRIDPPAHADERTMLLAFLDYFRATLLVKADGLTDEQGRTASVPPSILTITGLLRHMADVERHWFQRRFAVTDAASLYWTDEDPDGDLRVDGIALADAIAAWQREVDESRAITTTASLDDVCAVASERDGQLEWRASMRWILIHMIEEYARHAGHADLIRERIDGATGD